MNELKPVTVTVPVPLSVPAAWVKFVPSVTGLEPVVRVPPLKMVSQSKDGHLVYRYADPYSCDCLYVGDEQAYAEYKRLALKKQVAEERLEAAEAEESAAMDWGLWGPWWW